MELNATYQYQALNEDSYNSLAAYATTIPATVSLHPDLLTIVISENAAMEVGQFIDDNGLSFHISQIEVCDDNLRDVINCKTTDADTLRRIANALINRMEEMGEHHNDILAETIKERDRAREAGEMQYKWHKETAEKLDRVKSQIKAIETLIHSIFPEG